MAGSLALLGSHVPICWLCGHQSRCWGVGYSLTRGSERTPIVIGRRRLCVRLMFVYQGAGMDSLDTQARHPSEHRDYGQTVKIRVLGPIEAVADGQQLTLGGEKQRAPCHRSGCGVMIPRCTARPHYHVEESSAAPPIARTWTGGIAIGCTGASVTLTRTARRVLSRTSCFVLRSHTRHLTSIHRPRSFPKNPIA